MLLWVYIRIHGCCGSKLKAKLLSSTKQTSYKAILQAYWNSILFYTNTQADKLVPDPHMFFFSGQRKALINITLWTRTPWNHDWRHNSHKAASQNPTCDISNSLTSPIPIKPPSFSPFTTLSSSVVWGRSLALERKEEHFLFVLLPTRNHTAVSSFMGITTFKQQLIFDSFQRGDEGDFENSRMFRLFFCLYRSESERKWGKVPTCGLENCDLALWILQHIDDKMKWEGFKARQEGKQRKEGRGEGGLRDWNQRETD